MLVISTWSISTTWPVPPSPYFKYFLTPMFTTAHAPTEICCKTTILANFAWFPTLLFQIVFSLESACSNNLMSVGACALVHIRFWKYFKVFSGHSAGQHPSTTFTHTLILDDLSYLNIYQSVLMSVEAVHRKWVTRFYPQEKARPKTMGKSQIISKGTYFDWKNVISYMDLTNLFNIF